jgi:DNA-binding CsgD family transcriptional regulator
VAGRRDRLTRDKKALTKNPKKTLEVIFEVTEDHQLGWQTYLLDRFGVDAETMTILKESKPPSTAKAVKELLAAGSLHTFWTRVLGAKADAMAAAATYTMPYARRRNPSTAARSAVIAAFEELPATFGVIVQTARDYRIKEWAAHRLATWSDTQISSDASVRLRAALTERAAETNLSEKQVKLLELVPASLLAFSEWQQEDEPFRSGSGRKSYVSRVENEVVRTGSEQVQKNEHGKKTRKVKGEEEKEKPPRLEYTDPEKPEDGGEDQELDNAVIRRDREHNRRLLERIEKHARFTKQQRQVYELDKAGWQEAEIATRLGIAGSTVRVHRKRAMDATRKAAKELGLLDTKVDF